MCNQAFLSTSSVKKIAFLIMLSAITLLLVGCTTLVSSDESLPGDNDPVDPGNISGDSYSLKIQTFLKDEAKNSKSDLFENPYLHVGLYKMGKSSDECPPAKPFKEINSIETPFAGNEMEMVFENLNKDTNYGLYAYVKNYNDSENSAQNDDEEPIVAACQGPIRVESQKDAGVTSVTVELVLSSLFKNITGDFVTMFQIDYHLNGDTNTSQSSSGDNSQASGAENSGSGSADQLANPEAQTFNDAMKNNIEKMISETVINAMFKFYNPETREIRGLLKLASFSLPTGDVSLRIMQEITGRIEGKDTLILDPFQISLEQSQSLKDFISELSTQYSSTEEFVTEMTNVAQTTITVNSIVGQLVDANNDDYCDQILGKISVTTESPWYSQGLNTSISDFLAEKMFY
jgi:hypothetical protein